MLIDYLFYIPIGSLFPTAMKKCSNRANDIVVFVYFIALSELFEDGPFALSGNPVVIAYTLLNAIGKLVVCKYHELSFPRSDFPHWL